ncbi:MAG: tetratricopeptide repeat protein [bacterium]|nr:tetratricopeptide repeat protein [bacterium]
MTWLKTALTCVWAILLLSTLSGCGGGTSAGGTFGTSQRLTFEGWQSYISSQTPEELQAAEELFRDAVALDPSFSEAHNGLGWLTFQKAGQAQTQEGRSALLGAARSNFQRATTAEPGNSDAWVGLAGLELAAGNWAAARDAANRALSLDPRYFSTHDNIDFKDVHLVLAEAFFFLGAFVDTVETLDPNNTLHHLDLVDPGYKLFYHANKLTPPDMIQKIGELQGL